MQSVSRTLAASTWEAALPLGNRVAGRDALGKELPEVVEVLGGHAPVEASRAGVDVVAVDLPAGGEGEYCFGDLRGAGHVLGIGLAAKICRGRSGPGGRPGMGR